MAGCAGCENGYGLISIYDANAGSIMDFTIKGDPGSGKKVGNSVVIQRDKLSGGHRIWYALLPVYKKKCEATLCQLSLSSHHIAIHTLSWGAT